MVVTEGGNRHTGGRSGLRSPPMDFDETPEEAAFRAEVRAFLDARAPRPQADDVPDESSLWITDHDQEVRYVQRCRDWQATKYDLGWAGITWPKEYGGRGGTGIQDGIFHEEEAGYISASGVFSVGIGMAGPTIIAHGTDQQKERYLPPTLRGEEIWCQLFSEPNAGSDLGGLRTSAVRDGDEWVVNGQKVWTSGAHYSDWGILLTRSDPDAPKHRGITYFLVDMRTPGIEVRPLRQITGAAHFNEVFLEDVRIPHENIIGEVNAGWGPMMTTLSNERALIGGAVGRGSYTDVVQLARDRGLSRDRRVRQELARCYTRGRLLEFLGYRVRTAASKGVQPGPESSVMKLMVSQHLAAKGDLVVELCGPGGMLAGSDAPDDGRWQMDFLGQWGARIGGGTDEVQRNTIGEKVLRLPPEPRVDKGVPFRDIPG
jgi:alkylation response protein AidB-like acyl-CoA dehydrogenase